MDQLQQTRFLGTVVLLLYMATADVVMALPGPSKSASDVRSVLEQISDYEFGASRKPLSALRLLVQSSLSSQESRLEIEKEMVTFLASDAT